MLCPPKCYHKTGMHKFFQKCKSFVKILGARGETCKKFRIEDPQMIGMAVQNLVPIVTWFAGFVHRL